MINLQGEKFGMLTVISESDRKTLPCGQKIRVMNCLCDCGNEKKVLMLHLVRGRIRSCGCAMKTRNGESTSILFKRWKAMHERCMPNRRDAKFYYEKGIYVCDEWSDYFTFKEWAINNGFNESLTLDRINSNLCYSPYNCRWVSQQENNLNRVNTFFVEYNGEKISLMLLLKKLGKIDNYYSIKSRILRGWDAESAVNTKIREGNYRKK